MKRIGAVLLTAIACFAIGYAAPDVVRPREAEAGWATSGPSLPGTGSGALVGATSPTLTTITVNGATSTAAITASTIGQSGSPSAVVGASANGAGSYGIVGNGSGGSGSGVLGTATSGNGVVGSVSTGVAIQGTASGSGTAIVGTATGGGICLTLNGDTTSPTTGQIRMPVLDANPTSCQVGDMFMFTGGVLRVCTATTPTWVNVGSQ